jgi:hypothetical protein
VLRSRSRGCNPAGTGEARQVSVADSILIVGQSLAGSCACGRPMLCLVGAMETRVGNMKVVTATMMILSLVVAGCQSSVGGNVAEPISPARLEYVAEFKKIDTTGKGRITIEDATAYYSRRFNELDKNRDGFLDALELESMLPVMGARSGKELLSKLDRNADNKLTRAEFLVITNWLFEFASSRGELALGDLERGTQSAPVGKRYDPEAIPSGIPRGGPWETNRM